MELKAEQDGEIADFRATNSWNFKTLSPEVKVDFADVSRFLKLKVFEFGSLHRSLDLKVVIMVFMSLLFSGYSVLSPFLSSSFPFPYFVFLRSHW